MVELQQLLDYCERRLEPGRFSDYCPNGLQVQVTGEVRVVRLVAAHDSGRVINRLTYENQVFGGMTMGVGFGLTEDRVLDSQTGKMVNAEVPLSEMFGYATSLRSSTQGRASYSMEFAKYSEVPSSVAEAIIKKQ